MLSMFSLLTLLQPDTRIQLGIGKINNQVCQNKSDRKQGHAGLQQGQVFAINGIDGKDTHPRPGKDGFYDKSHRPTGCPGPSRSGLSPG